MKKILFGLLAIILVASLALSCAPEAPAPPPTPPPPTPTPPPAPPPAPPAPQMPERLVFHGFRVGTSIYAACLGISQIINQYTDLKTLVQPYPSVYSAFSYMRKGDVHLGIEPLPLVHSYSQGEPNLLYPKIDAAYTEVRLLLFGNSLYEGFHTRPDTGIKAIPDLKGRKVHYKTPGVMAKVIYVEDQLKAFGVAPEDLIHVEADNSTAAV